MKEERLFNPQSGRWPLDDSLRSRLMKYFLIALIVAFFAFPLTMICFFDWRYIAPHKAASVLLFFFR